MAKNLIVGMGQIGNGLFSVLSDQVLVECIDRDPEFVAHKIEILHIAFPYSEDFSKYVEEYVARFNPALTIVYSTVPIGTCEKLGVVHSPVEGKHPALGLSIKNSPRWLGSTNQRLLDKAGKFWEQFGHIRKMPSADFTEALKLLSTTEYGINIEFARYKKQIADDIGMDFSATRQWNMDYNLLYRKLNMDWASKYILDAPEGPKGGHCVTPNARILNEQYPSDFTKIVGEL